MRRALVTAMPADAARGAIGRTAVTDDSGRFAIASLPGGRYTLTVSKPGYVNATYGAARPGRPGTPIQLGDFQRLDSIAIRLARGAVVTGVVLDQSSEPMPSARITLMKYVFSAQNGERTLQPAGLSGASDDRGAYRIYGITPGDYLVQLNTPFALPGDLRQINEQTMQTALQQLRAGGAGAAGLQAAPPLQAPAVAYAPVFYPGTTSAADAAVLKLAAGDERGGIDLQVQLVPTAKIEGTVLGPDGLPASNVVVSVLGSGPAGASISSSLSSMFGGRPDSDGRFTLAGITPGHYTLAARTANVGRGGPGTAPMLWATAEVDVDGQDVSGVRLMLEPGIRVSGRVTFQGNAPPPSDLSTVRVTLAPILTGASVAAVAPPAQVDQLGTFAFDYVTPGRYRLTATSTQGWILKSAMTRGRDALDVGLEVRPNEPVADALLTFTDRTTALTGTLQDASGRPASDYFIIVYARDRAFWNPPSRRIAMMRPGSDGQFSTRILPAGEYLVAAVTDVEPGEWMDPAFLEPLVAASVPVALADGETTTRDIRIAGR